MEKRKKKRPNKQNVSRATKKSSKPVPVSSIPPEKDFTIVGIGASAGGLEAFTTFLKHLPNETGMAFVFISHQDPTHHSNLSELLKKITPIPLKVVEDRMDVEPDHIYIIPPNTEMTVVSGFLRLKARALTRGVHLPIDSFFFSLAEYKKDRAIGVVLSGTASDGTLGLKAIKAAHGITFAQDEKSSKYYGMPSHAIDADAVDFVLPPDKIAAEIGRIAAHPIVRARTPIDLEMMPDTGPGLGQLFTLLKKATGIDFSLYKPNTVLRRITRRILLHHKDSLESYVTFLKENPKYVQDLYEDMLISVTSFFRDPEIFDTLKSTIFPKIVMLNPEHLIRVWVPGCSSGEEAYSIAMALQEYLGDKSRNISAQIFATDISKTAIERARNGYYPANISNEVSPERLRRFFVKTDQGYQVQKSIRDLCIFAHHNVTKDPPFSNIDLLSCRNLLIYFGPVLQKKVVPVFHYSLNPNGYLVLGSSESIGGFSDYFFPADQKYKIYSKKLISTKMHFEAGESYPNNPPFSMETNHRASELASEKDVMREGDRLILSRYAPASVMINEDFEILQFRGRTGTFLEPAPGQASLNLMRMAREGLVGELRAALTKAKKEKTAVKRNHLKIRVNDKDVTFHLEVVPFAIPRSSQYFYLVFFELPESPKQRQKSTKASVVREQASNDIQRLRMELTATKEYLQSIIEEQEATNEELRAANEEILSSNEELQSTNEEMETAKEELQSANEELTTVNEELQVRNVELNSLNNDLSNLLASVYIPIVMLGRDLRIRRFTPLAERVFNLIPTDVGRPISDINLNISVFDLTNQILDVIDNNRINEIEVQDKKGYWYEMQIRPYKTSDNKIEGAVLVLIDIDALKKNAESFTRDSHFELITQMLYEPFVILDEKFRVTKANQAFSAMSGADGKSHDGNSLFEIADGRWNIPRLKTLLQAMAADGVSSSSLIVDHPFPTTARKKLSVNVRRLKKTDGQYLLLLSMKQV